MSRQGAAGGATATSAERTEGHEVMDDSEDEIPDTGMTAGHGTFVADTGDVRGHRSVAKQKVTEDILMRRIDTYGLVSPTRAKNI